MDLTCVTSGHAMSEDVIEQCETDLLDAQELENADDGDGDGDGDTDAFGNSDSSSASLRQNITLEEVAFVQEATNRTSVALQSLDVLGHLEYELQVGAGTSAKSKVALALMELTVVPGVLGLDRCYMGQCGLGIVKAATFGGLTVWFIFDFLAVVMTCLSGHKYMNAFGLKGKFIDNEITFAFWLALVWLLGMFMVCCTQSVKMMTRPTPVPGKNSP